MSVPVLLVYTQQNTKNVYFGPVKSNTSPFAAITNATVQMTLWKGRVPGLDDGTPVPGVQDVNLNHIGNGVYEATVGGASFEPALGEDYITTFDLTASGVGDQHWEIKSSVQVRSM